MPIPLILDTDIGDDVDDVFALLLAALNPEVRLLGVTTVFGDVEDRARIARKFLDLIGRQDVPVVRGHRATLAGRDPSGGSGAVMASAAGFAGEPESAEWDALGARLDPRDAETFLIETVSRAAEPVTVAAVGPLTNLASVLRTQPEWASQVRELVLMGGRLGDGEQREHNFASDAEATRIVLQSGAPLKIGTWNVTWQAKLEETHLARLRAGTAACRAAAEQLEAYFQHRSRRWTSMYDPLSLTMAYTDQYLRTERMALDVTPDGHLKRLGDTGERRATAHVSVDLDAPAFVEHLLSTLGA
jgi:purine nucleosidase